MIMIHVIKHALKRLAYRLVDEGRGRRRGLQTECRHRPSHDRLELVSLILPACPASASFYACDATSNRQAVALPLPGRGVPLVGKLPRLVGSYPSKDLEVLGL